ncbi:MAG: cytochrome c1 [Arenicellales bacterium]|jgi:ubiquinol-cytochrome c reductase cytochrome c1 subunit|nr:cytochrome c1 [Arenicellales bacterium]MDP6313084.1 cytochrome c1 [Arenicellales bacterium]MDP7192241.1 cytochrome c1 [Arenicellales bacterium]MDP7563568.1 cytochrome c1 [Arenicellales bacterium]
MMRKLLIVIALLASPALAQASSNNENLDSVHIDLADRLSLQKGANTFVNYCLSCHSAAYMRYERMASDLGISEQLLKDNLMFAADKPGELMVTTMAPTDAKQWFGVVPPDLSLTARSRGPDWIYTYLRSFYHDESTPTGWNNLLFPSVAMPHVLHQWQGTRTVHFEEVDGNKHFESFVAGVPGQMTESEYNSTIRDLTNFMVYLAEPAKLVRYRIGFWVMIFMVVFIVLSYTLKKEYWRDVH